MPAASRTVIRRRRGYWAIALILAALLARAIADTDTYRSLILAAMVVCWLALRRAWIEGLR